MCYYCIRLKTSKYQTLLEAELKAFETLLGDERMQQIFQELKTSGHEAMSRELVLQLAARYLKFWDRVKFLAQHLDLVIPYLFRIKQTETKKE